jgi:hypothetical protein
MTKIKTKTEPEPEPETVASRNAKVDESTNKPL